MTQELLRISAALKITIEELMRQDYSRVDSNLRALDARIDRMISCPDTARTVRHDG